MNHTILDQNYIDAFFGDSTVIKEMTNTEIKVAISQMRKQWMECGDYTPGIDPTAKEILAYIKH